MRHFTSSFFAFILVFAMGGCHSLTSSANFPGWDHWTDLAVVQLVMKP